VNYASWVQRAGGYIIDGLIVAPFGALASVLDGPTATEGPGAIYYVLNLLGFLVSAYNRWYLGGTTGQSWGRKALGITLVKEQTGQPMGPLMAFVRDLAHIVDTVICLIGWLFPLWDAKKQTLADKITGTVVINAR
jgi:uncharacterized RDD family membrane protein YckC